MPTTTGERPFPREDFSGGRQTKTTKFMQAANEVDSAVNAIFSRIGGVEKVTGMLKIGNNVTVTTTSTSTSTSTSSSTSSSSTTTMA